MFVRGYYLSSIYSILPGTLSTSTSCVSSSTCPTLFSFSIPATIFIVYHPVHHDTIMNSISYGWKMARISRGVLLCTRVCSPALLPSLSLLLNLYYILSKATTNLPLLFLPIYRHIIPMRPCKLRLPTLSLHQGPATTCLHLPYHSHRHIDNNNNLLSDHHFLKFLALA